MKKKKNKALEGKDPADFQLSIIYPNAAGIDVGSMNMFVSYVSHDGQRHVQEYGAYTEDLSGLVELLKSHGVTTVAMEATGVYWFTLYETLMREGIEVFVVNARHYKNVAGQKTDVLDCQWLHQLHAHGLLRNSHIPEAPVRELRGYIQERERLQRQKSDALNRIQKVLTQLNIKYQHLISDIEGVAGMQILNNIAAGAGTPDAILAGVNTKRLKASREELEKSLTGMFKPEYVIILNRHLEEYRFLLKMMLDYEQEIEDTLKRLLPEEGRTPVAGKKKKARKNEFHFNLKEYLLRIVGVDLTEIDGLDEHAVLLIIGVVGLNMHKWPTAEHFVSWLNLSPRYKKSGGKVLGHQKRVGSNAASQAFRLAAQTMWQNKGTLGHLYRRLSHTKGSKKAIKAVARRLAVIFYHMMSRKTKYDPKVIALDEEQLKAKKVQRLQKEAEKLGYKMEAQVA